MERRQVAELRRSFGGRVHEARRAARISQVQLAKRLGLPRGVAGGGWGQGAARLGAAVPQRHGGRDDESLVAREAFRQGWEAAYEALRRWLHERGQAV